MKKKHFIKYLFTIILFLISFNLLAQITSKEKLSGCWKVNKFEFLSPVEDSAELVTGMKNYIICFEMGGKYITKINIKNIEEIIGTGTYHISSDGKTIYQKRNSDDNGIDSPGDVVILNDRELAIKADKVILHFVKLSK